MVNPNALPENKVSEVIKKDEASQGKTTDWETVCSVVNNPYVHYFLIAILSVNRQAENGKGVAHNNYQNKSTYYGFAERKRCLN